MQRITISSSIVLVLVLAFLGAGCNEPAESQTEEEDNNTLFSCSTSPAAYQDLFVNREDALLRDALEQIALSQFEGSCLEECALVDTMTACSIAACETFDGGTVEYQSVTTWEQDSPHDPAEGAETVSLTITIDNPEGAELQHLELLSETRFSRGVENRYYGLDLTVSWTGSIGEDYPIDGSLNLAYTGNTSDGCFNIQHLISESESCSFEAQVSGQGSCTEVCSYTITPDGGGELTASGECPPFQL